MTPICLVLVICWLSIGLPYFFSLFDTLHHRQRYSEHDHLVYTSANTGSLVPGVFYVKK